MIYRSNHFVIVAILVVSILQISSAGGIAPPEDPNFTFIGKIEKTELRETHRLDSYYYKIKIMKITENDGGNPNSLVGRTITVIWTENISGEKCKKGDTVKGVLEGYNDNYSLNYLEKISKWDYYNEIYPIPLVFLILSMIGLAIVFISASIIIYRRKFR